MCAGVKWVGGEKIGWSSGWGSSGCVAQVCVWSKCVAKVVCMCMWPKCVQGSSGCVGVKWVGGQVSGGQVGVCPKYVRVVKVWPKCVWPKCVQRSSR